MKSSTGELISPCLEIFANRFRESSNPFSGEKVMLEPIAVAVYDCIKGAEMMGDYGMVEKGIDWFIEHYPKEYGVLLD